MSCAAAFVCYHTLVVEVNAKIFEGIGSGNRLIVESEGWNWWASGAQVRGENNGGFEWVPSIA